MRKFVVGDKVRWAVPGPYDFRTAGQIEAGKGPFTIAKVYDRYEDRQAIGHTQHVVLAESPTYADGSEKRFSGAFFKIISKTRAG